MPQALIIPLLKIAIGALLSTAVTFAARALMSQKPKQPLSPTRVDTYREISRTNSAPQRIVYGKTVASGVLAFAETVDEVGEETDGGRFLHMMLCMSEGPIEDIDGMQLNDQPAVDGRFANYFMAIPLLGRDDQSPLGGAVSLGDKTILFPKSWRERRRSFAGIAGVWCVLRYNAGVFPSGAPQVRGEITGKLVWDPRDPEQVAYDRNTWKWSDNWALCVLDYLRASRYGLQVQLSAIDIASFKAAADISDELVEAVPARLNDGTGRTYLEALAAGVQVDEGRDLIPAVLQKRYTVNGMFEVDQNRGDVLSALLQAGAGDLVRHAGQWRIVPGVPRTPTFRLTSADLRDRITIEPSPGMQQRANEIRGTFVDEAANYLVSSFPPQTAAEYVSEDRGRKLPRDVEYPFTTNVHQATRIAQIELRRSRRGMTIKFPAGPTATTIEASDVGWLSVPELGLNDVMVEATEVAIPTESGGFDITLSRYRMEDFRWDQDGINYVRRGRQTTLPSPFSIAPPSAVNVAEAIYLDPTGRKSPRLVVTISPPTGSFVLSSYRVAYRHESETTWQWKGVPAGDEIDQQSENAVTELTGLREGGYEISVQAVNSNGVKSEPFLVSAKVTWRSLPPPNVAFLLVTPNSDGALRVRMKLEERAPTDFDRYELRYVVGERDASAWATARYVATAKIEGRPSGPAWAQVVIASAFRDSTTYTLLAKGIDDAGQESPTATTTVFSIPAQPDRSQVVYSAEYGSMRWPGRLVNAVLAEGDIVEPTTRLAWASVPETWDDWTAWGENPNTLMFETDVIDLGREMEIEASLTPQLDGGVAQLRMRSRRESRPFGQWGELQPTRARYVQFRCVVKSSTPSQPARLWGLEAIVRRHELVEFADDIDLSRMRGHEAVQMKLTRNEEWQQARLNNLVATDGSLALGETPMLELAGDGYITVPHSDSLNLGASWTIEMDIRLESTQQTDKRLIEKGSSWGIALDDGVLTGVGGISGEIELADAWEITRLAIVYDGAAFVWFVDGVEAGTFVAQGVSLTTNSTSLTVFATSTGQKRPDGIVRRVAIYGSALSAAEIAEHVGQEIAEHERLVLGLNIDEGSGAALLDTSAEENDGTIVGDSAWVKAGTARFPAFVAGLVRSVESARLSWSEESSGGATAVVHLRKRSLSATTDWVQVANRADLTEVVGLGISTDADLNGWEIDSRAFVRAALETDGEFAFRTYGIRFQTAQVPWDFVYRPRQRFLTVSSAAIVAVQNAASPLVRDLVAAAPYGCRFKVAEILRDDGRIDTDDAPIVDLVVRGT